MQIDMVPRLCRQTDILYYSQLMGDCKYIRYETGVVGISADSGGFYVLVNLKLILSIFL